MNSKKTRFKFNFWVKLCIAMVFAALTFTTQAESKNLIKNGNFEMTEKKGLPLFWTYYGGQKVLGAKYSLDVSAKLSAKKSFKIDAANEKKTAWICIAQNVTKHIEPLGIYKLKVWLKASKPDTTARLELWWRDSNKKYKAERHYVKCGPSWKEYELKARMPEKSGLCNIDREKALQAVIGVKKGEVLWIDQVRITLNEDLIIQDEKFKTQ
jgi:carbohydrate binding protein with CBM4/9 domain